MQDLKAIRFIQGTKISHDYQGDQVKTFSYRELINLNSPAIGIPCRQNRLVIIDVDVIGPTHKVDGREFWQNFMNEYGVPPTYCVRTPSGGFHFYFRLPEAVNADTFQPPGQLAPGVDVKWNGWVGAPPTLGYEIHWGSVAHIQYLPPSIMAEFARVQHTRETKTFDGKPVGGALDLHRPFSPAQLHELKNRLEWMKSNGNLTRAEWRDGLFALKSGIDDPELLDEMVCAWTMNRAYVPGDENEARAIVARANKHGPVGPGSIFTIIRQVAQREGAPAVETPFTVQEILDRSKVQIGFDKQGNIRIEVSESNAAALMGAIFDDKTLYHDVRTDLYIYKGQSFSDADLVNMFLPILQSPAYGLGLEKFRKGVVSAGLDVLMAQRKRDPHTDYLKSLQWDGIQRIERFFVEYAGVEDTPYTRMVGLNFWTSLSARGIKPGIKFDSMVVLEGDEGIAKSSFVQAIGGEYTHAPSRKDCFDNLDSLRQMHQSVVVELPELIGIIGMDAETVKAFLAKPYDHIRALFARKAMKNDRGFIFIGTTNSQKYLSLAMGARRFWPIRIPAGQVVNMAAIKANRDQLFAEGMARFQDGHQFWNMPKELLDPIIEGRVMQEPLMGPIKEIIRELGLQWSTTDVYRRLEGAGYINRGLNSIIVSRIEDSLKRMGCERDSSGLWRNKQDVFTAFIGAMNQVQLTAESFI